MALRDLVSSESCAEGNPISNFVNWVIEDSSKSQQQDAWRESSLPPTHRPEQHEHHEQPFLENPEEEFEKFFPAEHFGDGAYTTTTTSSSMTNTSSPHDQALHSELYNFIQTQLSNPNMEMGLLGSSVMGLSAEEMEKIHSRAVVLKRQLAPAHLEDPSFQQFETLFNSLSLQNQPQQTNDWSSEFSQQEQHFSPTTTTTTTTTTTSLPWSDQFDQFEKQEQSQTDDFGDFAEFEKAYSSQQPKNWSEEFQQQENNQQSIQELANQINSIDDPKLKNSNFMKFVNEFAATNQNPDWSEEFEDKAREAGDGKWFWDDNQEDTWLNDFSTFQGTTTNTSVLDGEYEFDKQNHFIENSNTLPLAHQYFEQGHLEDAILCFEAHLISNPEDAKSWLDLGMAQAENDNDEKAILALKKSVSCNPTSLEAYLPLAVSLTNEAHKTEALRTLRTWLENHPQYNALVPQVEQSSEQFVAGECSHDFISELFIQTALLKPEDPDPDVQIALGLLYNLSYEYDKAVDCFRTSLAKRPSDYLLWNKLGATLANSGHCKEALPAYYRALDLKPTYQRAKANLQISYQSLEMQTLINSNPVDLLAEPEMDGFW